MAKFYAVKKGRRTGIFKNWNECKEQVDGYANAQYKSFNSYEDALEFLKGKITNQIPSNSSAEIIAYIDGSYDNAKKYFSYAGIIFWGKEKIEFSFADNDPEINDQRNVAGEIKAAIYAINFALEKKAESIEIFYDYAGIENWAVKSWKAKNTFTQKYVSFIDSISSEIKIKFSKVKSHSGDKYNEEVDSLAKLALQNVQIDKNCIKEQEDYLMLFKNVKSSKKNILFSIVIDEKIINPDLVYKKFKMKWKAKKYKLNEISELKTIFDANEQKIIVSVITILNQNIFVEITKGELIEND